MSPDNKFKPFQPLIHFVFPLLGFSIFLIVVFFDRFRAESQTAFDPLALFFQIAFILFLISPPVICVLLFLIWCELKKRSDK